MSKKEVLTCDREVWEQMRFSNEKSQIKKRYDYLLELMGDCSGED